MDKSKNSKSVDLCQSVTMKRKYGKMIEPYLLLLLHEKPSHGYELIEKLAEFGFDDDSPDSGAVYRNLRRMEKEGLVKSYWSTEGSGPARRFYEVTGEAAGLLDDWAEDVKKNIYRLEGFIRRYNSSKDVS